MNMPTGISFIYLIALSSLLATVPLKAEIPPRSVEQVRTPLLIVPNRGQWSEEVRFMTLPTGNRVQFLENGVLFIRERSQTEKQVPGESPAVSENEVAVDRVFLRFVNPSPDLRIEAGEEGVTRLNFYVGDTTRWRDDIRPVEEVRYRNLWEDTEVSFRSDGETLRMSVSGPNATDMIRTHVFIEGDAHVASELFGQQRWRSEAGIAGSTLSAGIGDEKRFRFLDHLPDSAMHLWTEFAFPIFGKISINPGIASNALGRIDVDAFGRFTFHSTTYYSGLPVTDNAYQRQSNPNVRWSPTREVNYFGRFRCDGRTADYLTYFGSNTDGPEMEASPGDICNNQVYMINGSQYVEQSSYIITSNALEYTYPIDTELCLNLVYGRGKKNGVSCLKPPTIVGFQHTNEWRIRHVAEYRSPV